MSQRGQAEVESQSNRRIEDLVGASCNASIAEFGILRSVINVRVTTESCMAAACHRLKFV